jgi:hypothetical protein
MIYDTFMFGDELDMLEMRLMELGDHPVQHVLVEARVDHQGTPKPLHYAENRERFAPWKDRITHIIAEGLPSVSEAPDPWSREHAQRENIWRGLTAAKPDDVVLLCDVDEIPSAAALAIQPQGMVTLNMRLAMFAADWVWHEPARIAVAGRYSDLGCLWMHRNNGPRSTYPLADDAGWHFSWLGGPGAIDVKARKHCHLELNQMILDGNAAGEWYEQGWTWHGQDIYPPQRLTTRMDPVDVDGTWPRYIRERLCPPSWFRPR